MASQSINTPYIVLGGVILAAIAVSFLLIQPLIEDIGTAREDIRTQEARLATRQTFLSNINTRIQEIEAYGNREQHLALMLPEEERVEDVLNLFHHYAQVHGIVIDSIGNEGFGQFQQLQTDIEAFGDGETDALEGVDAIVVSIGFTAPYQQFRAFLNEIEISPRFMQVQNISLDGVAQAVTEEGEDTGEFGAVEVGMSILVYVQDLNVNVVDDLYVEE